MLRQSKDAVLRQAAECRRRLKILHDTKEDVLKSIENTCLRAENELSEADEALTADDGAALVAKLKEVESSLRSLKKFEETLNRARTVLEDSEPEMRAAVERVERLRGARGGTSSNERVPTPTTTPAVESSNADRLSTEVIVENGVVHGPAAASGNASTISAENVPVNTSISSGHADIGLSVTFSNGEIHGPPITSTENADAILTETLAASNGEGHSGSLGTEITIAEHTSSVEITLVETRDANGAGGTAGSLIMENTSIGITKSVVADTSKEVEATLVPALKAVSVSTEISFASASTSSDAVANAAVPGLDYRKQIVSKGTGSAEDFCQHSIELIASRREPIQCVVSHLESLSLFWIQLYNNNIENIEDELNNVLESSREALSNPRVGDYCAAPVEDDDDYLHRAKILEIKNNKMGIAFSKLLFIDSGTIDWVATKALLDLPRRFRQYNRQACPCALAEVMPKCGFWDDDVVGAFRTLCETAGANTYLAVTSVDRERAPDINTVSLKRVDRLSQSETSVLIPLIRNTKGKVQRIEATSPMTYFEKKDPKSSFGGVDPPDVKDGWRCVVRANVKEEEAVAEAATTAEAVAVTPKLVVQAPKNPAVSIVQGVVEKQQNLAQHPKIYFRIGEIDSPEAFFICLTDQNGDNFELKRLTDEMNKFYSNPEHRLILPKSGPQYAVVLYTVNGVKGYQRIFIDNWEPIAQKLGDVSRDFRKYSKVTALFIDHGFHLRALETTNVFRLDQRHCILPYQSVLCKMFDCQPRPFEPDWGSSSREIFYGLILNKPLCKGHVMSEEAPYDLVAYRLDDRGVETCLNQKLVEANVATSSTAWM